MTHIVLFLLITAKDTDFSNISAEESVEDGIAETTSASCDEEDFIFEY